MKRPRPSIMKNNTPPQNAKIKIIINHLKIEFGLNDNLN